MRNCIAIAFLLSAGLFAQNAPLPLRPRGVPGGAANTKTGADTTTAKSELISGQRPR